MTRISKKSSELDVLRSVYPESLYPVVKFSEKPDFIVGDSEPFGVEITGFYIDGAAARLENMPEYASRVINDEYIHKDDVSKLQVVTVQVFTPDGKKAKIPKTQAVKQENLPITDSLALLVKAISDKCNLRKSYNTSLEYIDLIVYERRGTFLDGVNDAFSREVFKSLLIMRRFRPSYRHVYLVVSKDAGNSNEIFLLT